MGGSINFQGSFLDVFEVFVLFRVLAGCQTSWQALHGCPRSNSLEGLDVERKSSDRATWLTREITVFSYLTCPEGSKKHWKTSKPKGPKCFIQTPPFRRRFTAQSGFFRVKCLLRRCWVGPLGLVLLHMVTPEKV